MAKRRKAKLATLAAGDAAGERHGLQWAAPWGFAGSAGKAAGNGGVQAFSGALVEA